MNHEVDVVHQNPLAPRPAFDVLGSQPECLSQSTFDLVGDRKDLSIGVAVADDEVVGDVADAVKIEDDQIFSLLASGSFGAFNEFRGYGAGQGVSSLR